MTVTVAPFLVKTHAIFSDEENDAICSWGKDGDTIHIKDIELFAAEILPKHFKHSNYSSFTRQLHKYDFHKTVHNPHHGEFKHPCFLKGRPDMLEFIRRKVYVSKNAATTNDNSGTTDVETDGSSDKDLDFDFDFLGDEGLNDFDVNVDFDKYDEIESTVERGIIAFDDERITLLEKRQAHLMAENEETKKLLNKTLLENGSLVRAIDGLLDNAVDNVARLAKGLPLEMPEHTEGVCELMKAKLGCEDNDCESTDDLCQMMKSRCLIEDSIQSIKKKRK